MKQKTQLSLFSFFSITISAQSFEWGGRFGGSGEDVTKNTHVDDNGNSYTTGFFTDTADFDITNNETNLTSNGSSDVFVQKTNTSGNLEWAVSVGGIDTEYGTAIATDNQGNVYITGLFYDTFDSDPGVGYFPLIATGQGDIFIIKLDGNGSFIWAKAVGGTGYEESTSIDIDELANVYILGYLYDTADFDPGVGEFFVTSQGLSDVFLLILDSLRDFSKVYSYGGVDIDLALDLKIKTSTEIFLSGFFSGTADLDPRPFEEFLVEASNDFIGYTMQIDGAGAITNITHTTGGKVTVYAVEHDSQKNMYITGHFNGTTNFAPTSGNSEYTFTADVAYNGFILKVAPDGNVLWARQIASDNTNFIFDIAVNSEGRVYTTGYFENTVDFDPSATGEFILSKESENSTDAFMLVLNSDGVFVNAYQFGGVDFIDTHQIGIDSEDNILTPFRFSGIQDFTT